MIDRREGTAFLEAAWEEAEGIEVLEPLEDSLLLEKEREEAQGIEVFADPGETLPATLLTEGPPGEEFLTGDGVGLGREDESDRIDRSDEIR